MKRGCPKCLVFLIVYQSLKEMESGSNLTVKLEQDRSHVSQVLDLWTNDPRRKSDGVIKLLGGRLLSRCMCYQPLFSAVARVFKFAQS